jgi:hypothetical protein
MIRRLLLIALVLTLAGATQPAAAATGGFDSVSFCEGMVTSSFTITGTTDDGGGTDWVAVVLVGYDEDAGTYFPLRRAEYGVRVGSTRTFTDSQLFPTPYPDHAEAWLFDLTDAVNGTKLDAIVLPEDYDACTCSTDVQFASVDAAPVNGYVLLYTHFEDTYFAPDGYSSNAIPVYAGQPVNTTVTVACNQHVRAWLFDVTGVPLGYVPSQYENGDGTFVTRQEDYGTGTGTQAMYVASFANLFAIYSAQAINLPVTGTTTTTGAQISPAALTGGVLASSDLGDGLTEWGYYKDADDSYIVLGWSKIEADGSVTYAAVANGPFTAEELQDFIAAN